MYFIINDNDELDYVNLLSGDTVENMCESLETFFSDNPLSCCDCKMNCCTEFPIRPDNVFMKQLDFIKDQKEKYNNNRVLKSSVEFDRQCHCYVMPKQKISNNNFLCGYASQEKCGIYINRPILCRLYTCKKISSKWHTLMNLIVNAYKDALEYEIMEQEIQSMGDRGVKPSFPKEEANPVLYAGDYSEKIKKIIIWAVENKKIDRTVEFFY